MPRFKFGKLVRDKIVDHQIASGAKPKHRRLDPEEHVRELVNKIIEEAREISTAAREDTAGEIADVQQALDDLREKLDLSAGDISKAQARKNNKNGAFKTGLYIEYVEVEEDDDWATYYRKNSDRYPEL